jgi:hypothetical protein
MSTSNYLVGQKATKAAEGAEGSSKIVLGGPHFTKFIS